MSTEAETIRTLLRNAVRQAMEAGHRLGREGLSIHASKPAGSVGMSHLERMQSLAAALVMAPVRAALDSGGVVEGDALPSWEKHVRRDDGRAFCGSAIGPHEFTLLDAEHARRCVDAEERIQPCPLCWAVIMGLATSEGGAPPQPAAHQETGTHARKAFSGGYVAGWNDGYRAERDGEVEGEEAAWERIYATAPTPGSD